MILLRMKGVQGACDIVGGSEIAKTYKYHEEGWFPIESVEFGFREQSESAGGTNSPSEGGEQGGGSQGQTARRGGGPPIRGGTASGGSSDSEDEAFSTISINKFVDVASTVLMKFAMEDRKKTKAAKQEEGDPEATRVADIHFLTSVRKKDEMKSQFVFPYMMIHLENVLVRGWNINAQGDDRPTETLQLWYDKAAMKYFSTTDGEIWAQGGITSGWDQSTDDFWDAPNTGFFKSPRLF